MKKRALSVLLVLLMVFGMFPTFTLAANTTGHKISVKIYKVTLDNSTLGYSQEYVKTITVTCEDKTAHSGYNHFVSLKLFHPDNFKKEGLSTTNWVGYQFASYYSKGNDQSTFNTFTSSQVNATANVTGSEPYACSKNFYLVYDGRVAKPNAPTTSDAKNFHNRVNTTSYAEGAVYMWCDNNYDHHAWFSYLTDVEGGYSFGEVVANNGSVLSSSTYPWQCTMTIYAQKYMDAYNYELAADYGTHRLADGEPATQTVIWYYNASSKKWQYRENDAPVYIDIVCGSSTSTTPDAPAASKVIELVGNAVTVDCVNTTASHADASYALIADTFTVGAVSGNECTVTITDTAPYIAKYNATNSGHEAASGRTNDLTITLAYADGAWSVKSNDTATIYVACAVTPSAPSASDVKTLAGNVVDVTCVNDDATHTKTASYALIDGTFEVGTVSGNECTVTITNTAPYITKYNETYNGHLAAGEPADDLTITLVYAGAAWSVKANDKATINVACVVDAPIEWSPDFVRSDMGFDIVCSTVAGHKKFVKLSDFSASDYSVGASTKTATGYSFSITLTNPSAYYPTSPTHTAGDATAKPLVVNIKTGDDWFVYDSHTNGSYSCKCELTPPTTLSDEVLSSLNVKVVCETNDAHTATVPLTTGTKGVDYTVSALTQNPITGMYACSVKIVKPETYYKSGHIKGDGKDVVSMVVEVDGEGKNPIVSPSQFTLYSKEKPYNVFAFLLPVDSAGNKLIDLNGGKHTGKQLNAATLSRVGLAYNSTNKDYISYGKFSMTTVPTLSAIESGLTDGSIALEKHSSASSFTGGSKISWTGLKKYGKTHIGFSDTPTENDYHLDGSLTFYSLSFNANAGTDAVANMPTNAYGAIYDYYVGGETATIPTNVPTRDGYTFKGWAMSATGSVVVGAGESLSIQDTDYTLYAVWERDTYDVFAFILPVDSAGNELTGWKDDASSDNDLNDATMTRAGLVYNSTHRDFATYGRFMMNEKPTTANVLAGLADGTITIDRYDESFKHSALIQWYNVKPFVNTHYGYDDVPDDNDYHLDGKLTFYSLSFNANAGTDAVANMPTNAYGTIYDYYVGGETADIPTNVPTRDGYTFKGWAMSATGNVVVGAGQGLSIQSTDYTLYAVWEMDQPDAPNADFYKTLSAVKVFCSTDKTHTAKTYGLKEGTYTAGDVTLMDDGSYQISVTLNKTSDYLAKYIADTLAPHTLAKTGSNLTATLTWNKTTETWELTDAISIATECQKSEPVVTTYLLTIKYQYSNGKTAAATKELWLKSGETYSVKSPRITGYTADKTVVKGTMPAKATTIVVTYKFNYNFITPIVPSGSVKPVEPKEDVTPVAPKLNTGDHFAYVQGYEDGTVRPLADITRAETAAILFRLMDEDTRDAYYSTKSGFYDVDKDAWYNVYVATLNKAGIIVDSDDGYFRPDEAITRAELAVMLAQFAEYDGEGKNIFSDVASDYWAVDAIALTAELGWVKGYPDGTFRPDSSITRAEFMTMVNRALDRQPESKSDLLRSMKTWKDNADVDAWYYLDVQEATNSHEYVEEDDHETWTKLLDNPDWSKYE